MKKIFSFLLICITSFAYAEGEPVFEETNEEVSICAYAPFSLGEPIFEEDGTAIVLEKEICECDDPDHVHQRLWLAQRASPSCEIEPEQNSSFYASYVSWRRYKANFGAEKVFLRFPQPPAISQSNSLLTAFAYEGAALYSLNGYFPPLGHIDPIRWFDEILFSVNNYPFALMSHVIFQDAAGNWIMDYLAQDFVQNLIIKGRALVTPFNGYTLQCVKPNGMRDYFEYFLDNFWIKCDFN
jgi:hypothetical protein